MGEPRPEWQQESRHGKICGKGVLNKRGNERTQPWSRTKLVSSRGRRISVAGAQRTTTRMVGDHGNGRGPDCPRLHSTDFILNATVKQKQNPF